MKRRTAFLAAVAAALPLAAQAQPITGLYVGAGGGVNIMQNETDKSVNGVTSAPGKSLQMDVGATGVGSLGWGFGNGLRAELEFDYRYNSLDQSINPGFRNGTLHGSEQKFGPMANVLYDFNGLSPAFVPYIGAGAGYQWADVSATNFHTATGTAGEFAYQAIVGAAIPISAVPGLSVTGEYRLMGLAGDRTYDGNGVTAVRTDDFNHSVLIGLRYAFGAAPAPAPMAPGSVAIPAPAPARSYLVFFDWDKATLTGRAQQIVKEAADNATKVQYTRIDVNGYTDTSGTPQYNQGLSIRRGQAVAAELVRDGVPKNAIAIQGFGETHLLVATGPGVREPQNRRVEIIIH
ncbi:OmpA family protein [Acidisphaera sp. S103]|uniref:OmpA family protein n=1 Tax=Acidisphaera sp. S103 TaxID=1747223 RepID=UPI00131DF6A3|nr:OmpA family protein [Acidisphaera sp. S103]